MLQVWTMKLTESINICYISVRVVCTTIANMKLSWETMVPANVYMVNGLQSENNKPIT